jgi:tRNA(adenine34) deaminase
MKKQICPLDGMENMDIWAMKAALAEARTAAEEGEPPIGAVLVRNGEILASARNHREAKNDVTSHAELEVLRLAGQRIDDWRLSDCTLYVTLEPCPMCMGAAVNARIERVVFGASDPKGGACGGLFNLLDYPLNHHPETVGGVCREECSQILTAYFKNKREK